VRSLLAQKHPNFEIVVVDDRSGDATGAILERIARDCARLRVVRGEPLPVGWVGKPWALVQGACIARGDWLLFTDADTVHEPLSAASAQRCAIEGGYDAVSLLTDQIVVTFAERTILPAILLSILLATGPTDDVNDPRKPRSALFNGQYILASRAAYESVGGHAAVRAEIAEDLMLARIFKCDGRFRILLADANGLARTRMYRSLGEIWNGFVKNFAPGARGRAAEAALGLTLLACVSPLSPLLLAALLCLRAWFAACALAAAMAVVAGAAEFAMRRMRFAPGTGFWLAPGLVIVEAIFAVSLARSLSGRGVDWRGRRYSGGFGGA
jgi:chlorobactene glucosyltransferase